MKAVVNAIFYIWCAGCAWRMLPQEFPNWKTVYHYFRSGRLDGTWQQINHYSTSMVARHRRPGTVTKCNYLG
ncbi:MAG: hypothetical protein BRC40_13630 [Cyanobacteria bacterium QH_8_48_120]|nr:MAG: hypothetical protein BRC40_13630 [Cyanobacteria bacterium QH_8_48_120]